MNLFEFMSDSPCLTFFIALIIAEVIYKSINAVCNRNQCPDCRKMNTRMENKKYGR